MKMTPKDHRNKRITPTCTMFQIISVVLLSIGHTHGILQIITPVGNQTVEYCRIYKTVIPSQAYFDTTENTYDLQLELLDKQRSLVPLSEKSVQLNQGERTLYIVPVFQSDSPTVIPGTEIQKYFLRARNLKTGNYVDDCFYITINGNVPKRNFAVRFEAIALQQPANANDRAISDIENMYHFIEKLYSNSRRDTNLKDVQVFSYFFKNNNGRNEMSLEYQNCTVSEACDAIANSQIMALYELFTENTLSSSFVQHMLPNFNVTAITKQYIEPCSDKRYPPSFTPTFVKTVLVPIYVLGSTIPAYPGIHQFTFLQSYLHHEIQSLDSLRLELQFQTNLPVPTTFWAYISKYTALSLDTTTDLYVLDMVLTDATYEFATSLMKFTLNIALLDTNNEQANARFSFKLVARAGSYYVVTFRFSSFNSQSSGNIDAIECKYFLEYLISVLGEYAVGSSYRNIIFLKSFIFQAGSRTSGVAVWAIDVTELCNFDLIRITQRKMFVSDTDKTIKGTFKAALSTAFNLDSIEEGFFGPCTITPPTKVNSLSNLEVPFCGIYKFLIPENTFNDQEDGNTRKLTLVMRDENNVALPNSSWIQFNSAEQTIYAIPSNNFNTQIRQYVFKVVAIDASHQETSCDITVFITGDPIPVSYRVTVRGVYFPAPTLLDTNPALVIALRVAQFLGDDGSSFQLVSQGETTNGEQIVSFTNCRWRRDPCDSINIKAYQELFFPSGAVSETFKNLLKPEYPTVFVTDAMVGVCAINIPPTVEVEWGPLNINPCYTFKQFVPDNTFNDVEDGNTRKLKLTLQRQQQVEGTNDLQYWLEFDANKQELSILTYSKLVSSQYVYLLSAADVSSASAVQNLVINQQSDTAEPLHKVFMTIQVVSSSLNSYIKIYNQLRERLKFYFGDTGNTVEYISMSNYPTVNYEVVWTNCTLPKNKCDAEEETKLAWINQMLFRTDGGISASLSVSLQADFTITSLEMKRTGRCIFKPPIVKNLIPNQQITYCSYMKYTIPANTFEHEYEGNTRQLILSLRFVNGSALPNDYWLSFDTTNQLVYAILQSGRSISGGLYTFNLTATTSKGLTASTLLKVLIQGVPVAYKTYLRIVVRSNMDTIPNAQLFSVFFEKTATILNTTPNHLNIYMATTNGGLTIFEVINCDLANCTEEFINQVTDKLPSLNLQEYNPEFNLLSIDVRTGISCEKEKPKVIQPPNPFDVYRCAPFSQSISSEVFQDKSGSENLRVTLTSVNGQSQTWVQIENMAIVGLVTHDVLLNRPASGKYNLTIRATNKYDLYCETWVMVTVIGSLPQLFYKYDMTITDNNQQISSVVPELWRQKEVCRKVNAYFDSEIMNTVTYQVGASNTFSIQWSICNLPNECTSTGMTQSDSKIYSADDQPSDSFKGLFSTEFTLVSIVRNTICSCGVNCKPPSAKNDPLYINTDYCGGIDYVIPADAFSDEDDGDTRNLKLYFEGTGGKTLAGDFPWLHFNQETQTLRGMSTYDQAYNMIIKSQNQFSLTAEDKSGLKATIKVTINFSLPPRPSYWYRFIMSTFDITSVESRLLFMDKVASIRQDSNRKSIGFKEVSSNQVAYFNCSIPIAPCNLNLLNEIKRTYSGANDIPYASVVNAMKSEFDLVSVTSNYEAPCGGPNRPWVNVTPAVITISICGYHMYRIHEDTFYDWEDGNTRNLQLALTVKSGASFSMNNFVQYTSSTQDVAIIPRSELLATSGTSYRFSLTATDVSALSATTDLTVEIKGPFSLLTECQIQITLQKITSSQTIRTNEETMIYIMQKMASYFQITQQEIGIVNFYSSNSNEFYFAWSYCSALYKQESYESNSASLEVDYFGLQSKILMKLFHYDRKTVNSNFQTIFVNEYTVTNVKTVFSGRCQNLPPIVTPGTDITIYVGYGGYVSHIYKDNYFYDYEDGWAYSLTLSFLDSTGTQVLIDYWINVDVTTQKIYAFMIDYIRFHQSTSFTYYLQAMDSAGQYARIEVKVIKETPFYYDFAPFNITYMFQYNGQVGLVYSYQSSYIIDRITSYFQSITTIKHVLVRWYYQSVGYPHYRIITWSVAMHDCSSNVLARIKTIYQTSGDLEAALVTSLENMFTVKRVYYETTCPGPVIPPDPPIILPTFNVTYCFLFSYQLPASLFIDEYNGEAYTMQLNLLYTNGNRVSSSSWLQLNSATMKLYGIAIKSAMTAQSSYNFKVQATNSGGFTSTTPFTATIVDKPFTADCKMTMTFRYKYMTTTLVDLDIIRTFVSMIQTYYEDTEIKVKILNFYAKLDGSYEITWSNCSFEYSTSQEALFGLTESQRTDLTKIFSLLVTTSGSIVTKFEQHMTSYFEIITLVVNYDCIEKPPVPQVPSQIAEARFCALFNSTIPSTTFIDERDGNTRFLKLTLTNQNGVPVSIDNWVQIDSKQNLYGIVTEKVKNEAPIDGYKYILVATDSSGRTASIPYYIKVISPTRDFEIYFRTGFMNNFGHLAKTADILYTLVERMSNYINNNDQIGQIYVKEFNYPSTFEWSHCSLKPCTPQKVINIYNKLVTETGIITTGFMDAMKPEIIPTTTRINEVKPLECSQTNTTIIIVNPPPPNETVPNCGYFTYQIRQTLFSDASQLGTSSFYLNMYYQNEIAIPTSSWIRFNTTHQYIYGITILSNLVKTSFFQLVAKHQSSGTTATAITTINVKDYDAISKVASKLCYITFNVTVKYNQGFDDVTILKMFMETLAQYLNSNFNLVQIYSYKRSTGYPFTMSITWTNCTLTTIFQSSNYDTTYYTQFLQIINQLVQTVNNQFTTYTPEVQNYFQQTSLFEINYIIVNSNCSKPPNVPPTSPRDLQINVTCGSFFFKIPEDTFVDEQGGTSQLTLEFVNTDGSVIPKDSWIFLNKTQFLRAMITNDTIFNAVDSQYIFKLRATDSAGLTGETNVIVTVPSRPFIPVTIAIRFVTMVPTTAFDYDIMQNLLIIDRFNIFLKDININSNLYVVSVIKDFAYNFLLTSCDACKAQINVQLMIINQYEVELIALLSPELFLISLTAQQELSCDVVFNPDNSINGSVPYCAKWEFSLRNVELSNIGEYFIDLLDGNGDKLLPETWVWLNNITLEAYPPQSFWTLPGNSKQEFTYNVYADAAMTINTGQTRKISVMLNKSHINTNVVDFEMVLSEQSVRTQYFDNYYIGLVMNALKKLLGSGNGLHFDQFIIENSNPFTFRVKWQNCSLPVDCESTDIKTVNDILFKTTDLTNTLAIKQYFPARFDIKSIDNKCKNEPPKLNTTSLNLTIPLCGMYTQKLDFSSVTDDGGNIDTLKVTMLQTDGKALNIDSWILYNSTSREVYAFPTEDIINIVHRFQFQFEDTKGKTTNLPVYVTIIDTRKTYYELSITFRSKMAANTPYLDLQITMLRLISMYTDGTQNLKKYRVLAFTNAGNANDNVYYFRYGDCSVSETLCKEDEEKLNSIERTMTSTNNALTTRFQEYISKYFDGVTMKRETTVLQVDQPPTNINDVAIIVLTDCEAKCVEYKHAFYDSEQKTNLKYSLKDMNGKNVPLSHWTQITGDKVCAYPWLNVTPGVYNYTLETTDKCNSTATTIVSVNIKSIYTQRFGYKWSLFSKMERDVTLPDVYYLSRIRETMTTYLRQKLGNSFSDDELQIIAYNFNDEMEISFGECSIQYRPCNQTAITRIVNVLFTAANEPTQELLDLFRNVLEISKVTGVRQNPCGSTPEGPSCDLTKLVINTTLCKALKFLIPDVCTDPEDGTMRHLNVQLVTVKSEQLLGSSWIQFNTTSQTIYGYPMYSTLATTVLPKRYNFMLTVRDRDGNLAIIDVCVYLQGELPTLDYQLTLQGQLKTVGSNLPVDNQICIIERLNEYFNDQSINNFRYDRALDDGSHVTYTWSFCSMRKSPCDCQMVKKTQLLIKDMTSFQDKMKTCVQVSSVTYALSGECEATEKPELVDGVSEIEVVVGRTHETILPYNQFVDLEDGSSRNLTIIIRDSNNVVSDLEWMTVYDNKICGLMDYYDYKRNGYTKETVLNYNLVAIDACGKETIDPFQVRIINNYPGLFYRIHIWFSMPFSNLVGNCSQLEHLIQTIADYANVPKDNILIDKLSESNGTINGTYFIWGIRKWTAENCDDEEFEVFREKFVVNDRGNTKFLDHMDDSGYVVKEIEDRADGSCDDSFPWWILILILILLLLLLLLWFLWCCIPRCCPVCCGRFCPGCLPCCSRGGKYASLGTESGKTTKPPIDGTDGTTGNVENGSSRGSGSGSPISDSIDGEKLPVVIPGVLPLPLPPPYIPGSGSGSGGHFHTESWTDQRKGDIYQTVTRRRSLDDDYYNQHSHHHGGYIGGYSGYGGNSKHSHTQHDYVDGGKNNQIVEYHHEPRHHHQSSGGYAYGKRSEDRSYNLEKHSGYNNHHSGGGYYINKSDLRRAHHGGVHHGRYTTGKHARVRQPVAVRVRRSEFEEYLRQGGTRGKDGKIVLKSKDIEKLMQGNAKLSFLRGGKAGRKYQTRSGTRVNDVAADRRYIVADSAYKTRNQRSYSTSSLSDMVAVNQHGREVTISPQNVTFTMNGYEDAASTSLSSSSDDRRVLIATRGRSHGRRQYAIKDSTSDTTITPEHIQPYRHVNRRRVYEIKRGDGETGGGRRDIEMKKTSGYTTTKKTFVNKGYNYDDSEV